MEYGIGRIEHNQTGMFPIGVRITEATATIFKSEEGIGQVFFVARPTGDLTEGKMVFVRFLPDDQFAEVIRLEDVKLILNSPR